MKWLFHKARQRKCLSKQLQTLQKLKTEKTLKHIVEKKLHQNKPHVK